MKIAQVVTYISPDGSFGGPVTVARAQCAALAAMGHEVTLFAGSPVQQAQRRTVDGYTEHLFPARKLVPRLGFASMRAKGLETHLRKHLTEFDIAHVHMARDLVTLPSARALSKSVPIVLQPHGMIDRSNKLLAAALDSLATRKTLERADTVFSLTDEEDAELRVVAPGATVVRIRNGIVVEDQPSYLDRDPEVLFLARLHPRKRALAFVQMAGLLVDEFPDFRFSIVGPDEGDGSAVRAEITEQGLSGAVTWEGSLSPDLVPSRLRSASVFVLPSFGEVFPMTMLEAFVAGTPTVCTNSLGIAKDCQRYGASIVTDGSPSQLAGALRSILNSAAVADGLRKGAARYLREELDIANVAKLLESTYSRALRRDS